MRIFICSTYNKLCNSHAISQLNITSCWVSTSQCKIYIYMCVCWILDAANKQISGTPGKMRFITETRSWHKDRLKGINNCVRSWGMKQSSGCLLFFFVVFFGGTNTKLTLNLKTINQSNKQNKQTQTRTDKQSEAKVLVSKSIYIYI